ncbi:MAG: hypothetical protein JWR16_255 [Nevskia sp.]|nr:hypothetical protein [Nevskia sp.]
MSIRAGKVVVRSLGLLIPIAAFSATADGPAADTPSTTQAAAPDAAVPADAAATPIKHAAAVQTETLGPITVTAQKRAQNLQDVPIAITAINAAQLNSRGIDNIADLSNIVPGLQTSRSPADDTISQISIRGSTEINPAIYWDPAVGVYLDGVYIGKSQGSIFDVVDLDRVEVLRGPQGTLYGRNTIGGAINLISRKPTGVFDGEASIDIGNYNERVEKISLDLPRFGIASVSLAARNEQRDGWVTTTPDSSTNDLNDHNNTGLRLAVDLAFAPNFDVDYRFDHSNINQNGSFGQLYRSVLPGTAAYVSQQRQSVADINAPSYEHSRVQGHSLTATWNLGASDTLKSISAYRHLRLDDSGDYDGSPLPIAETQRFTHYHQVSQELQWVGHTARWNYVGGLYYFGDDGRTNNPQSYFGGNANAANGGVDFDSQYGTKTQAGAAYGQVDYRPIDPLTLTAGLRYTQEKKSLDRVFGIVGIPPLIPAGTQAHKTFEASTPTASISYKLNDNLNTYLRYAAGFKSGGFNGEFSDLSVSSADNIQETQTPFKPEKQKSLELGAKSTFLNNRAQLNLAVFQNKNTDLQESIFQATGAAASVIRNAGKSTVRGAELEAVWVPVNGTRLQLNYTYLDPKYDDFKDAGIEVADNRAYVHTPRNVVNALVDSRLLRTRWGAVRGLIDYSYTTSYYLYPYQLASSGADFDPTKPVAGDTKVKAYGLLNLRLSLTQVPLGSSASGEVAIWARNLANEDVPVNFIDFGPSFGNLTDAYFIEPRTFGITGIVRW